MTRTWPGLLALLVACATAPVPAPGAPGGGRAQAARVLVLSTMLAEEGIGEWGFAALVEVDGRRLLFDTGCYPDTVLRNAQELGVDLGEVEEVILSHHHQDHTGGLVRLRTALAPAHPRALSRTHVAPGIFTPRRSGASGTAEENPMLATREAYLAAGGAFLEHAGPVELYPGVWLTGPVPRPHPERNWSGDATLLHADGQRSEDTLPEDMSLVIDTAAGLIVISGCGHAGVVNTLEHARRTIRAAPVHALIGGVHLFPAGDERLAWTADELRARGLQHFLGAHCSGIEATFVLRARCGLSRATCVVAAVGSSFTLGKGIDPLALAR